MSNIHKVSIDELDEILDQTGIQVLANVLSARKEVDAGEPQIAFDIYAPALSVLPDCTDTAISLHKSEEEASEMFEVLNEVKRNNWCVLLFSQAAWANDSNGIHLHACSVSVIEKRLDKILNEKVDSISNEA